MSFLSMSFLTKIKDFKTTALNAELQKDDVKCFFFMFLTLIIFKGPTFSHVTSRDIRYTHRGIAILLGYLKNDNDRTSLRGICFLDLPDKLFWLLITFFGVLGVSQSVMQAVALTFAVTLLIVFISSKDDKQLLSGFKDKMEATFK